MTVCAKASGESLALRYKNTYYLFHNFDHLQEFGGIAAIHTFGRDLKWNSHIHFLVAEIIYDPAANTYKNFSYFNFESLRKTWRYEVTRLMSEHLGSQFKPLKNLAYRKNTDGFYVYMPRIATRMKKDRENAIIQKTFRAVSVI